ncbi:hypothetical protein P8A22_11020 [Streptomyces laculatispora]|uniref:Uncharacterized protein n=1 Tax=Streptomyces laculatispora TaxID=887464 RepID=A0ABY9I0W8_9ACTN|nr:hypothetical protein [Streptomyces laculatispora]WLQ40473.1 hypothetical protein P8A22_11020 [Streptomyces laculatispora]
MRTSRAGSGWWPRALHQALHRTGGRAQPLRYRLVGEPTRHQGEQRGIALSAALGQHRARPGPGLLESRRAPCSSWRNRCATVSRPCRTSTAPPSSRRLQLAVNDKNLVRTDSFAMSGGGYDHLPKPEIAPVADVADDGRADWKRVSCCDGAQLYPTLDNSSDRILWSETRGTTDVVTRARAAGAAPDGAAPGEPGRSLSEGPARLPCCR